MSLPLHMEAQLVVQNLWSTVQLSDYTWLQQLFLHLLQLTAPQYIFTICTTVTVGIPWTNPVTNIIRIIHLFLSLWQHNSYHVLPTLLETISLQQPDSKELWWTFSSTWFKMVLYIMYHFLFYKLWCIYHLNFNFIVILPLISIRIV